jgi:hypothetical protein
MLTVLPPLPLPPCAEAILPPPTRYRLATHRATAVPPPLPCCRRGRHTATIAAAVPLLLLLCRCLRCCPAAAIAELLPLPPHCRHCRRRAASAAAAAVAFVFIVITVAVIVAVATAAFN